MPFALLSVCFSSAKGNFMNMKKILNFCLALGAVVALSACGADTSNQDGLVQEDNVSANCGVNLNGDSQAGMSFAPPNEASADPCQNANSRVLQTEGF